VASVPFKESGTFKGQLRLVVPDSHFDLPTTGVSEDNLPGEFGGVSGFRSEEIPGGLFFTSSHDQPEGLLVGLVKHWKGNDTGFAFALVASIPEHAVVPVRVCGSISVR
jgi:hypothetical protein